VNKKNLAILFAILVMALGLVACDGSNSLKDEDDDAPPATASPSTTPSASASATQPATATATKAPDTTKTTTPSGNPTGDPQAAHFARIEGLDPSFRSGGWTAWLSAAGIQCKSIRDARQPEEETNSKTGRISVSGLQVVATNCQVNWPSIVTTDVPSRVTTNSNTVQYKPDPNNGSVLYTNVVANGEVTIYADGQNWGQFTSVLGFLDSPKTSSGSSSAAPVEDGCFTISELDSKYGIDRGAQGTSNGILIDKEMASGAALTLTADEIAQLEGFGWTIQGTNPVTKSAWSPERCRPLAD